MARDTSLLQERNQQIRADFNRIKAEEQPLTVLGIKVYIRLNYSQTLAALSKKHFISARRIEVILGLTETKLANLGAKT